MSARLAAHNPVALTVVATLCGCHAVPGYFLTKIFHPNVAKNGEICVNTLKRDWKREYGIAHILLVRPTPVSRPVEPAFANPRGRHPRARAFRRQTIKCLLIVPNPESALNEEAGKLLLERYEDYAKHAQLMTSIHALKTVDGPAEPAEVDAAGIDAASDAGAGEAVAKKRAAEKKDDKKVADKKRSLKRL